ncbi:hypothetical protein GLYMA_06G092351v4 [Glycine max]|nr:hypothetical protein GLYMA_06G092351v4 [Glycine max]KAH1124955.1 hypothetical protein GYH30_014549 [Glycine max]
MISSLYLGSLSWPFLLTCSFCQVYNEYGFLIKNNAFLISRLRI